jgi:RNA-directed DNA polymerase
MTKAPISLQDLRRSLYVKAKAEPPWRFWGLYVHVCKMETLREAYQMARKNDGAPGIDGVTFEAIEESGAESFLGQIREELVANTYRPMRARKKEIPKDGGKKVRILSIPAIRDRVVQGALKLILEPIFEADFQAGSYGYRPKRTAHEAVARVAQAIVEEKTRIIDLDLSAYFDNVQHCLLLEKVAQRVSDDAVMHLLKMILKATGKKGVPQGGVMTPRTQKITSSLSGGWDSGGNRVRIDACRMRLYVYDRCHAPARSRKPSASIARAICCCASISSPMRSNSWPRTARFRCVRRIATSNKLSG